ncbi:MAG: histone deacetylase [Steroidobacteraceae bacterium]
MKVSHHPDYYLPLPEGHPFPMVKYTLVYDRLRETGLLPAANIMLPEEATRADLERVHEKDYLDRLFGEGLSATEQRAIGVPWSPRLLRRSRLAVQGTILAAEAALEQGRGGNLAGGTHHAFADHGEGFCVLNDIAVAIRRLQHQKRIERALVIDLDVHQGNGTAAIFEGDDSVFTFSMHGERNYPSRKMRSSLDVGLPDGIDDDAYLSTLEINLPKLIENFSPDVVFYLAGVDVAAGDRYGRFNLSDDGIRTRDRCVLDWTRRHGLPLAITLAGGYSPNPVRTAMLHTIVFEEAMK